MPASSPSTSPRDWPSAGFAIGGFAAVYLAVRLRFAGPPDRLGGFKVAAVSLLIEAAGQVLMWQACSAWAALVGAAISGIGFSLVFPSMGVEAVRRLPPQNRGAAAGGCVAFFDLALGIGGPAAGLAATAFDYPAVFLVGAVSSLGAIGPALATRRGTPQAS